MTDNAPERIWIDGAVKLHRWEFAQEDCTLGGVCAREYVCDDLYTAVCAERDALKTHAEKAEAELERVKEMRDQILGDKINLRGELATMRVEVKRFRDLLHGLLQVQDGVPMTGLAATRRADAARAALQEKARVDSAEADLELESERALVQPNADPMRELVEAVAKGPLPGEDMRRWIDRRMKEAAALRALEQGTKP